MNHKSVKAKNIQDILFPKRKMTFVKEIYNPIEPKLVSTNYLMLHGLLLIRGNSPCNLCKKTEDGIHHILFNCASLAQTRGFVQRCLQQIGVNNFDQFNIIEMTGMKDMPNYIISLYKDTIWKDLIPSGTCTGSGQNRIESGLLQKRVLKILVSLLVHLNIYQLLCNSSKFTRN